MDTKRLLKPACFLTGILILWLGPIDVFSKTSYQEEKLHIAIGVIATLLIIAKRLNPSVPTTNNLCALTPNQQVKTLRKQLKFQWHLLQTKVPFELKNAQAKLVIANNGYGRKASLAHLYQLETEPLPFAISWYYDQNSIICSIAPELIPEVPAQHSQHLFQELARFLRSRLTHAQINQAYALIDVQQLMQTQTSKCIDAYNYTLTAISPQKHPIPLTVILTKCDKIAGFVPFFEHLDQSIKQANWAIKLNEFDSQTFEQGLDKLLTKLNNEMICRLHTEAQHYRRILIKDLPIQFEKLRPMLLQNLTQIIKSEQWPIRQIAFTSAEQNGNYIDLINQKLGMQSENNNQKLTLASQRYFCDQIFQTPNQNHKAKVSSLLSETWCQAILTLTTCTLILIASQAFWLQNLHNFTEFQLSKMPKPKIVLAKDAGLWRKLALQKELTTWLKLNPIPKYLKIKITQNAQANLNKAIIASITQQSKTCKTDLYSCLQTKWQPFADSSSINQRLHWLKQHASEFKHLKLNKTQFNLITNNILKNTLASPIKPGSEAKWLSNLLAIIKQNQILPPKLIKNNNALQIQLQSKSNRQSLEAMQTLFTLLPNETETFKYLKATNFQPNPNLPKPLKDLEQQLLQKLKPALSNHINLVWQQTINKFYKKNLANKYPFDNNAKTDAELKDVEKLFKMHAFFQQYYLTTAAKIGLKTEPKQLAELIKLQQFLGQKLNLSYRISSPHKLKSDIKIAELNIAGKVNSLANTSIPLMHWPIQGYDDTVSIWLQNKAGKMAMISRHGPWGIFRLIDNAGKFQTNNRQAKLNFQLDEQSVQLAITFARPWAKLNISLPSKLF